MVSLPDRKCIHLISPEKKRQQQPSSDLIKGGHGGKYRHSAIAAEREDLRRSDVPASRRGFSKTGASVLRDKKVSMKTRDTLVV